MSKSPFEALRRIPLVVTAASLTVIVAIGLGGLSMTGYASHIQAAYAGKIYPGILIDGIDVGGMDKAQAEQAVQQRVDQARAQGLSFTFDQHVITLDPGKHPFLSYDVKAAVDQAFSRGRDSTFLVNAVRIVYYQRRPLSVAMPASIQHEAVQKALDTRLDAYRMPAHDAQFRFDLKSSPIGITTIPEQAGQTFDTSTIWQPLQKQADGMDFSPIALSHSVQNAHLTQADLEPFIPAAQAFLSLKDVSVTAKTKVWPMDVAARSTWLSATTTDQGVRLAINGDALQKSVQPLVDPYLAQPQDGKLILEKTGENYTFKDFTAPVQGIVYDKAVTTANMQALLDHTTSTPIQIELTVVTPKIEGDTAIELGIREALGTGYSDFSGSPSNRRKNIAIGMNHVNGTLVAPDQEFSLLHVLGPVDGEHGWLPELVIKDNKTQPDFGGGLCQIGTTAFRTAIESGLPITERQNHSYRVRYYEPAGTDATIYDPAPDFKFKNDTGHWILVTGSIKGNSVSFTIWGTADGRIASHTQPKIWAITPPPPTKYIETLDLPPGKEKCTETAHAGAQASFDYTVTSALGETKSVTFHSFYKPWQAVCLKGVSALSVTETSSTIPLSPDQGT